MREGYNKQMPHPILTCLTRPLPGPLTRLLRAVGAALVLCTLAACAGQEELPLGRLPDGTVSVLLTHIQGIGEDGRRRIAALEVHKDWDGLAKFAEENIAANRNIADWWLVAGYAHAQAGRNARSIEYFTERVRLAPDDLLGWNLLAQSYRDTGRPQRAVQTLNNAHLVRQGTPATWYLLGESYSDLDRFLPAAAAYREAVQLERGFAQAWFGLGRAYSRLGRRPEYEQALKALEPLDPALAKKLAELRPGPR